MNEDRTSGDVIQVMCNVPVFRYKIAKNNPPIMKFKSLALTAGLAVSGIVTSGAATPANAFQVFFGEDTTANTGAGSLTNSTTQAGAFLSHLSGAGTETFESFNQDDTASNIIFPGVGTATITSSSGYVNVGDFGGRFPISGSNYYEVGGGTFTINFSTAVAAFGFYGTDLGDFDGQLTLSLSNGQTLTVPHTYGVNPDGAPDGSAIYYGIIASNASETFTSVTFGNTNSGIDYFGFDNLTVGTLNQVTTAVPEPFTIIGTLVGGSAAMRMRKKLKSRTKG
jgi:hypothetical protein